MSSVPNKVTLSLIIIIALLTLQQCNEENVPIIISSKPIPLEIEFLNESAVTEENDTLLVRFQLTRSVPEAVQILVEIDQNSTLTKNEFSTSPSSNNNIITISMSKGDSIAGFYLYPDVDTNFQADILIFNIVDLLSSSDVFVLGKKSSSEILIEEKITSVQFEKSNTSMLENEVTTIKIKLSHPAIEQSSLLIKLTSDIAIYGEDYSITPIPSSTNTLEFLVNKGTSVVTFDFISLVDNDEDVERIIFDIISVDGYNLVFGEITQFSITISDTYTNQCNFTGIADNFTNCLSDLSESTLDIVTWNWEFFPTNGNTTIGLLKDIIPNMNADIIAIQEINNIADFNELVNSLEGWEGEAINVSGALDLAYLYKTCEIEVLEAPSIELKDIVEPRPSVKIKIRHKATNIEVTLLNIHLKCCGETGSNSANRREAASKALQNHINTNLPNEEVIVLGDWNDDIHDGPFDNFLNDNGFAFADEEIANGPSSNWSYPGWPSHLDHILITNELFNHFVEVKTIKLDACVNNIEHNVSDHRAVLASFQ